MIQTDQIRSDQICYRAMQVHEKARRRHPGPKSMPAVRDEREEGTARRQKDRELQSKPDSTVLKRRQGSVVQAAMQATTCMHVHEAAPKGGW